MSDLPFVTAMIVARNEENYIEKCLQSLIEQSYPSDLYEILIIDGMSTDKTIEIAKQTIDTSNIDLEERDRVSIRYFTNPRINLASGWNTGIKNAKGEYVVRIDAHAYADVDFIKNSVNTILKVNDVVCVGGAMETESISSKGNIIKEILSSPFGVGGSKFRYSKSAGYVDTVAYGLYKKEIFDQVGFFDETLDRTQDNDLHRRIRAAGGKFYLNPEIKTVYYSRDSVIKMMRQAFLNGKWTMINFKRNPGKMAIRHFVPFAFICSLISSFLLGFISNYFWLISIIILLTHLILGLVFSLLKTQKMPFIFIMPLLFLLLHSSYGMGSIAGIFKK